MAQPLDSDSDPEEPESDQEGTTAAPAPSADSAYGEEEKVQAEGPGLLDLKDTKTEDNLEVPNSGFKLITSAFLGTVIAVFLV
jgi:hypothetical protein